MSAISPKPNCNDATNSHSGQRSFFSTSILETPRFLLHSRSRSRLRHTMAADIEGRAAAVADQGKDEHNAMDAKIQVQKLEDARGANVAEHETMLKQALKQNWRAAMWSAM